MYPPNEWTYEHGYYRRGDTYLHRSGKSIYKLVECFYYSVLIELYCVDGSAIGSSRGDTISFDRLHGEFKPLMGKALEEWQNERPKIFFPGYNNVQASTVNLIIDDEEG